jgi:hypothetical protein
MRNFYDRSRLEDERKEGILYMVLLTCDLVLL